MEHLHNGTNYVRELAGCWVGERVWTFPYESSWTWGEALLVLRLLSLFEWQLSSLPNGTRWTLCILSHTDSYSLSARMWRGLLWVRLTFCDLSNADNFSVQSSLSSIKCAPQKKDIRAQPERTVPTNLCSIQIPLLQSIIASLRPPSPHQWHPSSLLPSVSKKLCISCPATLHLEHLAERKKEKEKEKQQYFVGTVMMFMYPSA